jgi:hypothetical protein
VTGSINEHSPPNKWRKALTHFKLRMKAYTSANSWGFRMRFIGGMELIGVAV